MIHKQWRRQLYGEVWPPPYLKCIENTSILCVYIWLYTSNIIQILKYTWLLASATVHGWICLWAGISWAYVTTSRAHGTVHERKLARFVFSEDQNLSAIAHPKTAARQAQRRRAGGRRRRKAVGFESDI